MGLFKLKLAHDLVMRSAWFATVLECCDIVLFLGSHSLKAVTEDYALSSCHQVYSYCLRATFFCYRYLVTIGVTSDFIDLAHSETMRLDPTVLCLVLAFEPRWPWCLLRKLQSSSNVTSASFTVFDDVCTENRLLNYESPAQTTPMCMLITLEGCDGSRGVPRAPFPQGKRRKQEFRVIVTNCLAVSDGHEIWLVSTCLAQIVYVGRPRTRQSPPQSELSAALRPGNNRCTVG